MSLARELLFRELARLAPHSARAALPMGEDERLTTIEEQLMSANALLFRQYPLNAPVTISTGPVPTPYHIYDGYGIFMGGTVDLSPTRRLLGCENVRPVETQDGRTPMGIWICNFSDASLGPHHELQFSFFVKEGEDHRMSSHPLGLVELMTRDNAKMLCHGLWNNTARVVAYNRELLSLNSRLSNSHIEMKDGNMTFKVLDTANQETLLSGVLPGLTRPSPRTAWDAALQLGLRRTWKLVRQPWIRLQIVNPIGVSLPRNGVAESFTKVGVNLLRYFDVSTDILQIGHPSYAGLGFKPEFVQYMQGFKFVYLQPS